MYQTQLYSFLVELIGFVAVALHFEEWRKHEYMYATAWFTWGLVLFMTLLRTKYEFTQLVIEFKAIEFYRGASSKLRLWRAVKAYMSDKVRFSL